MNYKLSIYKISGNTLKRLERKNVPKEIIGKLIPLKNIEFKTEKDLKEELAFILGLESFDKYSFELIQFSYPLNNIG